MKVIIPERVTMPQKPFLREDMPQRTLEELSKGIPRRKILSARVENADFGVAYAVLRAAGYKIPSSSELAKLVMQEGQSSPVLISGFASEAFAYLDDEIILMRDSPILASPLKATQLHEKGKKFSLDRSQLEEFLKDSVEIKNPIYGVSANNLNEDVASSFLLRDSARNYGEFLKKLGSHFTIYCPKGNLEGSIMQAYFSLAGDLFNISGDVFLSATNHFGLRGIKYATKSEK